MVGAREVSALVLCAAAAASLTAALLRTSTTSSSSSSSAALPCPRCGESRIVATSPYAAPGADGAADPALPSAPGAVREQYCSNCAGVYMDGRWAAASSFPELVGNTPLLFLPALSAATGCRVYGKAEWSNPGGSPKDRVARQMVVDAEAAGLLGKGGVVFEGTAGSTGISLALMARSRGYGCHVVMSDDMSMEKVKLLEAFGAHVERVRPASIIDSNHFVNVARRRAEETEGGFFTDQFENLSNFKAHYTTTGPEIWRQMDGRIDALVMAAGTGGTVAGISRYIKEQDPGVRCFLIDPQGSSLYHRVNTGVLYSPTEKEGTRKRHQIDTITEGIGINRLTDNFKQAVIDQAFRGTDNEAVHMARFLMQHEGLFVGSSSAMNCVGAVKVARQLGPGHTIVTLLCDTGTRHLTKFWSDDFLRSNGLSTPKSVNDLSFVL